KRCAHAHSMPCPRYSLCLTGATTVQTCSHTNGDAPAFSKICTGSQRLFCTIHNVSSFFYTNPVYFVVVRFIVGAPASCGQQVKPMVEYTAVGMYAAIIVC